MYQVFRVHVLHVPEKLVHKDATSFQSELAAAQIEQILETGSHQFGNDVVN
jgi:hypothetical protein